MIHDKALAAKISRMSLEIGSALNASAADVQANADGAEFEEYRFAVGKVMAELFLEIMKPIYQIHPDLKPAGIR